MKSLSVLFLIAGALLAADSHAANSKIGILVFDGVLTSDVTAPAEVFGAATKKAWFSSYEVVTIAASNNKAIKTEEGLKMVADYTIGDPIQLDVLIVPSSYKMTPLEQNKELIAFIKKQGSKVKWLASNCSGALLLAQAGLLDGKKATTWYGGEKELASSYPKVNVQYDQNVVIDGNLITSNGGAVSYQASLALLAKMTSPKFAQEISDAIQLPRLTKSNP